MGNNSLAILLISAGIFVVYLESTGKLSTVLGAIKSTGKGGQAFSDHTTTQPVFGFRRGRYFVSHTGALMVTDAGTY